ncbi:MAG: hypothetical protein BalsKO_18870 [Balneolaceae bacterium]
MNIITIILNKKKLAILTRIVIISRKEFSAITNYSMLVLVLTMVLSSISPDINAQATYQVSDLKGFNGGRFNMSPVVGSAHFSGSSVAKGDVNGDGIEDLIIGSEGYFLNSVTSGIVHVVFGDSSGSGNNKSLMNVNGTDGFLIVGENNGDVLGQSVSSGDINNDGIDDIIIGASGYDDEDSGIGATYVVYGKSSFSSTFDLSTLNGSTGFKIKGIAASDQSGFSLSSGDINNDGIDDVLIGATGVDSPSHNNSGASYVVYGKSSFASTFELSSIASDSTLGFAMIPSGSNVFSVGNAITTGDFNDDNIDDVLVGGYFTRNDDLENTGAAFVVFGSNSGISSEIDIATLDGTNGFALRGETLLGTAGESVASGDLNGDGISDMIIGSRTASPNSLSSAGETYVVFGKNTAYSATIDLSTLNGTSGFKLSGKSAGDNSGFTVTSGNFNNDGFDDLAIRALNTSEVYIIFGKSTFSSSFDLSTLDGDNGITITGFTASQLPNGSLGIVDFNGDGIDELILGDSNFNNFIGRTYIIYNSVNHTITGDEGFRMLSAPTNGAIFDELLGDFWTQGFTGADISSGTPNVWTWHQSTQVWTALTNQSSNTLAAGDGILWYAFSDDNGSTAGDAGFPKFINTNQFGGAGTRNSGDINPVSNLTDGDFYLMGNPYAAAIDWDRTQVVKTNLSNTIYVYDDANSTFQTWNGTAGNIEAGRVAPFQSFFIQANGGVGEITIGEGAIRTNKTVLLKSNIESESRVLKISATSESKKVDTWLSFQQGGELSRDNYDGLYLQPLGASYLRLGTIIDTEELLQINALPIDQQEELSFPLELTGNLDSTLATISFEGLEGFEGWELSLLDTESDESYPILGGVTLELVINKIVSKETIQPALPTPTPVKTKAVATRYRILIKPSTMVNNELNTILPTEIALDQNYPNPFNPSTTINFSVPEQGNVQLEVFDMVGRKVAQLLNEPKVAGTYSLNFDASQLASGLYIYRFQVGGKVLTKKMTLIK